MAVNKVQFGNQTLIDITDTTAEESNVENGKVFYKANGVRSVGSNTDSSDTKDIIKSIATYGVLTLSQGIFVLDEVTPIRIIDINVPSEESVNNKVDKEDGKGLSTNDYTDSEKDKVSASVINIERNGLIFTATRNDGTSFTFDQIDTTYANATESSSGLMSAADKQKLEFLYNLFVNNRFFVVDVASDTEDNNA